MLKLCLSVVVALFLSGCANGHRYGAPEKVIVDTLGDRLHIKEISENVLVVTKLD